MGKSTQCQRNLKPNKLCLLFTLHTVRGVSKNCLTPRIIAYADTHLLYYVCAEFAQHIGIYSNTTVCNPLLKATKERVF
jgi:hypothetical protein